MIRGWRLDRDGGWAGQGEMLGWTGRDAGLDRERCWAGQGEMLGWTGVYVDIEAGLARSSAVLNPGHLDRDRGWGWTGMATWLGRREAGLNREKDWNWTSTQARV